MIYLEKAAKAIFESYTGEEGEDVCSDFIKGMTWQELTHRCNAFPTDRWLLIKRVAYHEAKAAIEAIGVIVLPHDAKPEVGDIVQSPTNKGVIRVDERCDSRSYQNNKNTPDFMIRFDQCIIIQRNGQPVIQDPTPSSVEGA